jgi:hypothetical protein
MKKHLLLFGISSVLMLSVKAEGPLKDYSFIRGVCYPGGWMGEQAIVERDMGYAKKLQLNSTRIWLGYQRWVQNPTNFIDKLRSYIRTANKFGISTMPILFNGNNLNPAVLKKDFWETTGDKYVKAVVAAIKDEPGLIMWDIMNEPTCNDYLMLAPEAEKATRLSEMNEFVRHYCTLVKQLDPKNALTVGHTWTRDVTMAADLVDVISFHDYLETRKRVDNSYVEVEKVAKQFNKPIINSELGCVGRANPVDMALEICEKHKAGWYVFELLVQGYWGDVHGLVYPDGTIRDPSIIAAIYGFHINRDLKTAVKTNPNKEGYANKGIKMIEDVLKQETKVFQNKKTSTDDILEACEYCANLLEAGEMVPMNESPTAKILAWRAMAEKERDVDAIRTFAYELGLTLKKKCTIF